MTDNDYIAEYIKEKFPKILGIDFFMWKSTIIFRNGIHSLIEFWKGIDVSETCDDTEDDEDDAGEAVEKEVLKLKGGEQE